MNKQVKQRASNCKYVQPTVMQPAPVWLEAEDAPWTCVRKDAPRPLADTEICEDCPFWEPQSPETATDQD